jgi:4-hydroxy-4-methyl-2-oxoglutarate aldolase
LIEQLLALGSATLHEASGRVGALGPSIRPAFTGARLAGPCRTVRIPAGDNLGVHLAIEEATAGEVLCVSSSGTACEGYGIWGEILTLYARESGIAGLVTSCGIRDVDAIAALDFPVFARDVVIQGTVKNHAGDHQVPIRLGTAVVRPGDWLVCDTDGCVNIRASALEATTASALERVESERRAREGIAAGQSTRSALGLGARHASE